MLSKMNFYDLRKIITAIDKVKYEWSWLEIM